MINASDAPSKTSLEWIKLKERIKNRRNKKERKI
jgi:hypothetical protein